jgi:hypothetical protein
VETFGDGLLHGNPGKLGGAAGGSQSQLQTNNNNITIHNNYNSNLVAYINPKTRSQLPAIGKSSSRAAAALAEIEESPIIMDGSKHRKQSKNSQRSSGGGPMSIQ